MYSKPRASSTKQVIGKVVTSTGDGKMRTFPQGKSSPVTYISSRDDKVRGWEAPPLSSLPHHLYSNAVAL